MTPLLLLPVVLSTVVLAAHFLRSGHIAVVVLVLATIPLLFVRRRWVMRLVQVVLVLGALEWVRTTVALMQLRLALGQPFARMVLVLGAVALVTAFSALLFESRRLRRRYAGSAEAGPG